MRFAPISPALSIPAPRRRLRGLGGRIFTAASVALAAAVLVPALFGFQRYVITSGSMTGTYDRGSLVFDEVAPTSDLRVGDVITYDPPDGAGPGGLVTHRIHSITTGPGGTRIYRTKGDANVAPDSWTFALGTPTQARAKFHIPYVGYAFAALADRRLRMILIGLPALLVAVSVLTSLWRDAGAEAEAARAEPRQA
ncbi:MAG: signal peptidase [Solirubrobacteraceae bacterium]|jgi:signal peptidase|nr:signal peptidase [Solirubrobacteraceae bacterium]